jgi:D-alanyl-D-alanine carboxypeptidase (penicillin-binding protein 5/6)
MIGAGGVPIRMLHSLRRRLISLVFLLLSACLAMAAEPLHVLLAGSFPAPPALTARSAILIEARTGAILFENHADDPIPPASLTKLMTLHIALQRIDDGLLDPSRVITPPPDSWARNLPPHSSVMFLGPGQRLTIDQLLKGLVVDSGNDAAVALADVIAGSVPAFADVMNEEASRLGYHVMRFVEPSGLSSANLITAREYVDFCRRFVTLHPRALADLFSLRELTYPLPENLSGDNNERPITQKNTNILLGHYEGVDGLKTGHIDESGYNFAATARRGNMRLISVILGVPDQVPGGGLRMRAVESAELLDYGFSNFTLVQPTYAPPSAVHVWKGSARLLAIAPRTAPSVVVPRGQMDRVAAVVEQRKEVIAPVAEGQVLGHIVVRLGKVELASFPLQAMTAVPRGGLLRRALDSVALLFHRVEPAASPEVTPGGN